MAAITCETIIRAAYRRAGIVRAMAPLSGDQAQVGLEQFQGMLQEMSQGLLGQVRDYYNDAATYTACEFQRIYNNHPGAVITIPTTVAASPGILPYDPYDYGFFSQGAGTTRAPIDGAVIIVVDPAVNVPATWLYNIMLAKWQNIVDLTLTSVSPLAYQFEEPLKNLLAVVLADEKGISAPPIVTKRAALGKLAIASRRQAASRVARNDYS